MPRTNPGSGKIISRLPSSFKTPRQEQKVKFFGECAKDNCSNGVLRCVKCDKWWKLDRKDKTAAYEKSECPFCQHKTIIHNFFCNEHQNDCRVCYEDHPLTRKLDNRDVPLGCPFRALRDGKPIQPEHKDWLRKRIGAVDLEHEDLLSEEEAGCLTQAESDARNEKAKNLLLFLFGDGKGRVRATNDEQKRKKAKKKPKVQSRFGDIGRVMKLLEAIHNREVESYDGWERTMSPSRRKHAAPSSNIKAGMEKARAAGTKLGAPRGPRKKKLRRPRKNSK